MSHLTEFLLETGKHADKFMALFGGVLLGGLIIKNDYFARNIIQDEGHEGKPGKLTPLDTDSEQLGKDIIKSIKVDKLHSLYIQFFTSKRPEVISKGSPLLCKGVFIGVPYCFRYKSADEIKLEDLQLFDQGVDWSTQNLRPIFETMIYTDIEKRFSLSQELFNTYSYFALLQPFCVTIAITMWYIVCYVIFNPMFYIRRHVALRTRISLYFICNCIGIKIGLWSFNGLLQFRDRLTIKKTVDANKDLALAGLTYYQKCLERNKMLYSLPNSTFQDKVDSQGNFVYPFYEQRISLTERRSILLDTLKRKGILENIEREDKGL